MRFPFLVLGVWCMVLALTTGPAAQATPLEEAAARFKLYALDQIDQSLAGAEALRDAVAKGDLPKAQA
ncbi:MAG TPA: hypothetical protein VKT70_11555, partial [Stellaceae bacterium]|nr:hypothetical protein [Stellaceae bacterium]